MQIQEFGLQNQPVVLLLENKDTIESKSEELFDEMTHKYHIIVMTQDKKNSMEVDLQEVDDVAKMLSTQYQNKIYAFCSVADSWDIAKYLLLKKEIISDKTIIESSNSRPNQFILSQLDMFADSLTE